MTVDLDRIKEYRNRLNEIIKYAENRGSSEIKTSCNTYGMSDQFISFGYDGYLDLDKDIEDMVVPNDDEDDDEEDA